MEEIKNRIKEALSIRQMLPVELARKSGISKGSISKYMKGDILPKRNAIGAMADALGVSPAWLMGYDVTMDGELIQTQIEVERLNTENQARLLAYYQALLDSQGDDHANT